MADYIVTSGELTTVANAIREKNGTSSSLSWPNGFVSGISSGGGGSSDFSTAEVTLINTSSSDPYTIRLIHIANDNIQVDDIEVLESKVVTVPLYKGQIIEPWNVIQAVDNSWIGSDNVTIDYNPTLDTGGITIKGDGTFTAKGAGIL